MVGQPKEKRLALLQALSRLVVSVAPLHERNTRGGQAMCIGEGSDSLGPKEISDFLAAANAELSFLRCDVSENKDGMVWIVLEPRAEWPTLPKFTICRIDPCLVVMIARSDAAREFRSATDVKGAVHAIVAVSRQAMNSRVVPRSAVQTVH